MYYYAAGLPHNWRAQRTRSCNGIYTICRGIRKHDINFGLSYEKNEAVLTAYYFVIVKCRMNHCMETVDHHSLFIWRSFENSVSKATLTLVFTPLYPIEMY